MKELKELIPYQNINKRCIYYDKKYDPQGIDYSRFIKLRKDIEKYTPNEWYLLWYLMSESFSNGYYTKTTIGIIIEQTKLNIDQIRDSLISLQNRKIILCRGDLNKSKRNDKLELVVGYNLDEYYHGIKEFVYIPLDFVNIVLPTITSNEWYIYCALALYYNFEYNYAFPSINILEKKLNISHSTISKTIQTLSEHKYNLIEVEKFMHNDSFKNNIYRIRLFQRLEYCVNYNKMENINDTIYNKYKNQSKEYYQANKRNYVIK